jgi:hypothetical protein
MQLVVITTFLRVIQRLLYACKLTRRTSQISTMFRIASPVVCSVSRQPPRQPHTGPLQGQSFENCFTALEIVLFRIVCTARAARRDADLRFAAPGWVHQRTLQIQV